MERKAVVLVDEPVIAVLAGMALYDDGIEEMARWIADRRPACLPDDMVEKLGPDWEKSFEMSALFPHSRTRDGKGDPDEFNAGLLGGEDCDRACDEWELNRVTDNELLVELAGRKCYDSFGLKAGRKTNAEYIANTQQGDIPHASIMYHAKMTFFFAGVSRRVSHELIRNYVGSDRTEEGSPSQESTRYVEHAGRYVMHPRIVQGSKFEQDEFTEIVQRNYSDYLGFVSNAFDRHRVENADPDPKGMARKRIYEAASSLLIHSCETSWIWTTNPIALAKMIRERANAGADLEFQRFAKKLARVCVKRWPNLFMQPWVREAAT